MTWTQQIKDKAEQALDNWAERYGETVLRALDGLTHRHDALSVLLTIRYGETFEELEIEEITFKDSSSDELSFWCGDKLVATKLSEDFAYGFVIRRIFRRDDGRLDVYVGQFHDSVPVSAVESEVGSILEQAKVILLERRELFDGSVEKSDSIRQSWADLEQSLRQRPMEDVKQ